MKQVARQYLARVAGLLLQECTPPLTLASVRTIHTPPASAIRSNINGIKTKKIKEK